MNKRWPQAVSLCVFALQVKVWFQNRRTKQKKDQGKDSDLRSVVSETAATCSVLRLLEQGRLLAPQGLPALLPHCSAPLGSSPLRPSSVAVASSSGGGRTVESSPAMSAAGGGSGGGTGGGVAGVQNSPITHSLLTFPMPSLLSGISSCISSNHLSMAGSISGNLQELSARFLSSSAFEPYARNNGKESIEKINAD